MLPPKSIVMFPFRLKKMFTTSRNGTTNFSKPNSLHQPPQNYSTLVTRVTFSDKQGSDWKTESPGSTCTYNEFRVLLVIHKKQKRIAKEKSVWETPELFLRVDLLSFTNSTTQEKSTWILFSRSKERAISLMEILGMAAACTLSLRWSQGFRSQKFGLAQS